MPGHGVLAFLPGDGEQLLGPGNVRRGPPRETEGEEDMGPEHQRPCLPYLVARPAQQGQGTTQVVVGLAEAAHVIKDRGAPHERTSGQAAVRGRDGPVQDGQPLPAAARPGERCPEGGLHVGLALGLARRAGQPHPPSQLGNRRPEIAAIAQDDPDRVVSQRGVVGAGLAGQQGTRGQQGIVGPGHSERQELGRVGRAVSCIRISRFHSDNARQVPTPNKGSGGSYDRSGRGTGRAAEALCKHRSA